MVSQRGIEANPKKVKAILDMTSPTKREGSIEVDWTNAALNKFIARATDKCLPFFKTLKQAFQWIEECEVAFQAFKEYFSKLPLLSPFVEAENLFLYLAISQTTVSLALICEELKI
nr:hypothetical protein CFP56_37495 [Quercus suber]